MKTLKKTLCLVLAVVMVVGALVLPASAAAYKDLADITNTDYKTAVTTLQDWRVMEGDANGNFKPKASIQRQEMAAIIYRLLTGDNKGYGKDNSAIYTPYAAKFTDVDAKGWAAGYIGYCANKGIIVGTNEAQTTFEPTREIPGNDVLCMLLRALGYGMNKEYQGADWAKHVAADAARLHLTDKITAKLDAVSERQEVAYMTYQAATAARVTWSDAEKDYIPYRLPNQPNSEANIPLVNDDFADTKETKQTDDEKAFGIPGKTTVTHKIEFTYPVKAVPYTWTDVLAPAMVDYWVPVPECKVAKDCGLEDDTKFTTYTNGVLNVGSETIDPLETVNTIGHQGRHTLVYKDNGIIVYIDTYLAKVISTTDEVTDPAGHVITEATATLTVYGNKVANPNSATAMGTATAAPITAKATIETDAYAVGDMLYVNVVTTSPRNAFDGVTVKVIKSAKVTAKSVTVSEIIRDSANWTPDGTTASLTEVGFKGTDGTTYLYNYTYGYNTEAAPVNGSSVKRIVTQDIGKTYTVYLDTEGNVLGVDTNPVSNVGVVTSVNIALVTGTTNQYVIAYNMLMPDGKNVTVYGVDPATQKPYTSAANAQKAANKFWNETTNPAPVVDGENKDAGILAKITPIANGYYTVAPAGTVTNSYVVAYNPKTDLKRGEANAFWLIRDSINGGANGISNIMVDSSTTYFVANYGYNYTADEYQFKNFTISDGFKSVMDMSYDNTKPNASTAPTPTKGTGDIDGQDDANLYLEVSAFDTDADGRADYVLVLNANKQQVPEAEKVLNYAYLMTNPQFVTTASDQNVYGAIINGTDGQTLTLTANVTAKVLNTGLYTYSNKTNNGWDVATYVNDPTATPYFGIAAGKGWNVKDDVLVNLDDNFKSQNSQGKPDKYLTLADDCKVFLVNPTTGKSVQQTYALTTLDDVDVYGTNEIVYQFDADGYVDLIYIVAKGGSTSDTQEPGEGIKPSYTVTLATDDAQRIKLPDPNKKTTTGADVVFEITAPQNDANTTLVATVTGKKNTATVKIELTSAGVTAGGATYNVTVSGVTEDVTVTLSVVDPTKPLAAPAKGETLVVPEGVKEVKLEGTVEGNVTLSKGNTLKVDGTTEIKGTLEAADGAAIEVTKDGKLTVGTVPAEAEVTVAAGGSLTADTLEAGADITVAFGESEEDYGKIEAKNWNTAVKFADDGVTEIKKEHITSLNQGVYENSGKNIDTDDSKNPQKNHHYILKYDAVATDGHNAHYLVIKFVGKTSGMVGYFYVTTAGNAEAAGWRFCLKDLADNKGVYEMVKDWKSGETVEVSYLWSASTTDIKDVGTTETKICSFQAVTEGVGTWCDAKA